MQLSTLAKTAAFTLGATALVVGMSSNDAHAKKKKKKNTKEAKTFEIVDTGISAFDDVFNPAKEMLGNLATSRDDLNKMNNDVATALGLEEGTPIADALGELKSAAPGMLKIEMDGMKPKVVVDATAPDNVKAAIDAINAGGDTLMKTVETMKAIPEQAKAIVDNAKALPGKVPDAAKEAGLDAKGTLTLTKQVKNNVQAVGSIPGAAKETGDAAVGTLELIKGLAG